MEKRCFLLELPLSIIFDDTGDDDENGNDVPDAPSDFWRNNGPFSK